MRPSVSHSISVAQLGLQLGGGLHLSQASDLQVMLSILSGSVMPRWSGKKLDFYKLIMNLERAPYPLWASATHCKMEERDRWSPSPPPAWYSGVLGFRQR